MSGVNVGRPLFFFAVSVFLLLVLFLGGCSGVRPGLARPGPATVGEQVVETARHYLGTPYLYGGRSPKGFDCSGLTSYVYARYGYNLPRSAKDQLKVGRWVSADNLRPGDLVFFKVSGSGGVHVGIFTGRGCFIHAPRSGKKVETQRLDRGYYRRNYITARRVLAEGQM
ncbi:MAG: C40 family peptidase [Thermodesulfobacteriota bacterium]